MERALGDAQYVGVKAPEARLFQQYHSEYTEEMKCFIVSEICKKDSKTRFVFTTVALGLGLDTP